MSARSTGFYLVLAVVTFWLAWALMPDAATNDAERILEVVREAPGRVLLSVAVQLVSCVAFVPALLGTLALPIQRGRSTTAWGAGFLLVGVLGMCADAIFHRLPGGAAWGSIGVAFWACRPARIGAAVLGVGGGESHLGWGRARFHPAPCTRTLTGEPARGRAG